MRKGLCTLIAWLDIERAFRVFWADGGCLQICKDRPQAGYNNNTTCTGLLKKDANMAYFDFTLRQLTQQFLPH